MTQDVGFQTQREKMIAQYKANGGSFIAKTKPYYSTQQLILPVVDALPLNAPTVAHAKLTVGQQILFFAYKLGDQIPFGPSGATKLATDADTNVSKPRLTNGVEDFVIEGISMTCKSVRLDYSSTLYSGSDADVKNAFVGKANIFDPAAIDTPPQMYSPFNLEAAIWEAIKTCCSIEIEWDRSRIEKLFRGDQMVEGGGRSYLRSSGEPTTNNRVRIPEGYLWRREGMPDSELVVRLTVQETTVIPINLVSVAGGSTTGVPNNLYVDLTARLHGISLCVPSQN